MNTNTLCYATLDTPIGTFLAAYAGVSVRYANLNVDEAHFTQEVAGRFGRPPQREERMPERLERTVRAFLEGQDPYPGPVDLTGVPEFQQRALRKAMEIKRGEVRSYGWIAREIGVPGAARGVGTAMARNPIPILIPCHRVVRADYHIGQYGCGGPTKKREILRFEGVDVDRLEELGRRGVRFEGCQTTHIFCLPGCYTGRRMKPENRVLFASEAEARTAGFRPCKVCRPV